MDSPQDDTGNAIQGNAGSQTKTGRKRMRLGVRSVFLLSSFGIEMAHRWTSLFFAFSTDQTKTITTHVIAFMLAVGVLYLGILGAMDTLADVLRWANPFGVDFDSEDDE